MFSELHLHIELPGENTLLEDYFKRQEKNRNSQEVWHTPTQTTCSLVVNFVANALQIWEKAQQVFTYNFSFFLFFLSLYLFWFSY